MNIVLVGASKGIGNSLLKQLNNDTTHQIIAIARNKQALNDALNDCEHQQNIEILPFDVANGNFEWLKEKISQFMPSIDVIIYNAGILINKTFDELSEEEVNNLFQTNTFGAWKLVKHTYQLINKGGHILTIGSMGGFQGSAKFGGLSAYSASKAALACWSECLAEELKPQQIAVNCICLGAVQTDMLSQAFPSFKAPLSADEMAQFIAYFALSGHRFFNGKVIPVSVNTP